MHNHFSFNHVGFFFQHSHSVLNHRFRDLKKKHLEKTLSFMTTWGTKKKKKTKKTHIHNKTKNQNHSYAHTKKIALDLGENKSTTSKTRAKDASMLVH